MITEHVIIGLIGLCLGGGMVYFAKKDNAPFIVKPFISTWWIKSETANRIIATIIGYSTIAGSLVFLGGGLAGKKLWPFP